ncbi:4a-hydroxytetrahydrobiopterin dehydratase [Nakamurella panacisegetis]|uniref:Putative pterin-4-alpha-carbinolamine dehydratase n=1 Tax=Nakamurella panacisegetis TaxID=1090615 RepID=A0A1H0I4I6_9ACTN|nr:4a-hydroxytetrahydrobiopterin dehydratase [Nakamurella panacisegetis]SDO26273.1 4a-hydroxytetrahydrobiopterin dehydratase [Nakamurella panacisegetis]
MTQRLDETQINRELAALPAWSRVGDEIQANFTAPDFIGALAFVNSIAALAEAAGHHPDIDIRYNVVSLALTTHDAKGLTHKDFALAKQIDIAAAGIVDAG